MEKWREKESGSYGEVEKWKGKKDEKGLCFRGPHRHSSPTNQAFVPV